jgi:serine/threonine protein kinase
VDARADVWSLGVILHECLSGHTPFGGTSPSGVLAAIVADPPEPLAQLRPDLPPLLLDTVARCLEKDPEHRVQNVAELGQLLAVFAPEQAQRSLPRIAAVLGRTLHRGTTISSPPSLAITAMDERPPVLVTTPPEPTTVTVMSALVEPTWTSPGPQVSAARGSSFKLVSGVLGLVLVLGGLTWALGHSGEGEASATVVVAEQSHKSSPPQVVVSSSALTPVKRNQSPLAPAVPAQTQTDPAQDQADQVPRTKSEPKAPPKSAAAKSTAAKPAAAARASVPAEPTGSPQPESPAAVGDFALVPPPHSESAPTINPLSGRK